MKILITGGTGSLGVALLKEFDLQGHTCTIYSRDEVKQAEVKRQFGRHNYVLGDVRDADWLEICMKSHEVVIHCAAYKMVPAAEVNSGEAIETNVIGSRNVARAAVRAGVARVVGISTDKACAPINCYGETKALMEKLFQQANLWGLTQFNLVRYGNVLGSRGSVVPLFRQQMLGGKPITITDRSMTRFWMNLYHAVALVLEALDSELDPGVIIVPRALAASMDTLAAAVIDKYAGVAASLYDEGYVHVIETGIRPGEKMHEQLIHSSEAMHTMDVGHRFHIYPAYEIDRRKYDLPTGFEYSSRSVLQLTKTELACYL